MIEQIQMTIEDNLLVPAPRRHLFDVSVASPRIAQTAASLVVAIGCLVLVGWLFDVTFLKSVVAGLVTMKPNTALGFVFAGAGCLLAALHRTDPRSLRWRSAAAMAVTALGTLTLFEWMTGIDLGIDQLLFQDDSTVAGSMSPGRMSPWSALNFMLFGAAILLLDVRKAAQHSTSQSLAMLGCFPMILSFLGYVFGASELYGAGLDAHIALHTNVAFVLLAVGIFAARPEWHADKSALKDYGIAILAVALAFLVRWMLWSVLGTSSPFLIHLHAIIIAAWYGGIRSGFLATLLSALGVAFFIREPRFSLEIADPAEQFGIAFFVFLGTGLSLLVERAQKAERLRLVSEVETRAMRAASAYNRSLIEARLDPLVVNGPDGKITDVNAATEQMTGRARQELIGTEFADCFTEPDRARAAYQEAFREGIVRDYALEIRHQDGHVTPVLYNASVYRDDTGQVIGVSAAARDISERNRNEAELSASENRFRSLVEATSLLVWNTDPDGQIEDMPKWREFTGQSQEEVRGSGWLQALHPDDHERAETVWRKALAERSLYDVEYRVRRHDGAYREFLARGVPVLGVDSNVREWVGTCTDITERKSMEAALVQRAEALERSNKELEQFAYVASHDLQEPLRMIASYVELLAQRYQGKLDEKADKFIHYIVDGATRMQTLINDLLMFSRVATRGNPFTLTSAETSLADVLTNLKKAIADKEASVTHDPLPDVMVDSTQFEQVLQNLIANALKFCEQKPQVHLGAVRQGDEWLFSVRDNGIGIAKEHMSRLFVIFQRLHTRSEYVGTGIGLAVCKKVVERHGGRIWIESQPGQGSTFFFTIPI